MRIFGATFWIGSNIDFMNIEGRKGLRFEGSEDGNEPKDEVPDFMRNSQDVSFHYSERTEVSLP